MDTIKQIIAENLCVEEESCCEDCYLIADLGADSLSLLALYTDISELIDKYINVPDKINDIRVKDIKRLVNDN